MTTCLNCSHWRRSEGYVGFCHRYPPRYIEPHEATGVVTMLVRSGEIAKQPIRWAFPATVSDSYCGEFAERQAGEEPRQTPDYEPLKTTIPPKKKGWFDY